jgi:hypothetical protein
MAPRRLASVALGHLKEHSVLYASLLLFVLAIVFIDPLRESGRNDEWAYALNVQDLLQSGRYRPHDWLAANPAFQVYWGALFSELFGFSFSSLKLSTAVLALGGSISFYGLLKEHGIGESEAGLLTLALLASPLVLQFSIKFQTDVPFLMLSTAAVFFYTRAIRLHSCRVMFIGSILACLAVLTRQFGVGLAVGLGLVWMTSKARKTQIPFYLAGVALPVVGALWQLYVGFVDPNWTMPMKNAQELHYLEDVSHLVFTTVWRPAVILLYVALYASPILLFAGLEYASKVKSRLEHRREQAILRHELLVSGCIVVYVVLAVVWGWATRDMLIWLPYLPWSGGAFINHPKFGIIMTILALAGAALLGRMLVTRFSALRSPAFDSDHHRVVDFVTVSLFLIMLAYVDLYDWYLICLIPYSLLVIGLQLKDQQPLHKIGMAMACIALMAASALWVRSRLSLSEAYWKASDHLLAQGIPASQVSTQWEWTAYHEFDQYLADINYKFEPTVGDFFDRWLRRHNRQAPYAASPCPVTGKVLIAVPYQTIVLGTDYICAFEKQ